MTKKKNKGFTLLEILLVIVAIGILAAIVLVAINPNRQIAQARNTVRQADINTIQKAVEQYLIEKGSYPSSITTTPGYICNTGTEQVNGSTNCSGRVDLRELVPDYIAGIPRDPQATGTSTGYNIVINVNNNKVTVSADLAENQSISINPLSIVQDGLVLYLDAGNPASYPGTGNTWFDLSGNGNNGTLVNGVGYNTANGGSLVFDGLDDGLRLIHNAAWVILSSDKFSLGAWFYTEPNTQNGSMIFSHQNCNNPAVQITVNNITSLSFRVGGNSNVFATYTANVTGKWNYVVTTFDGASGNMKLYLNSNIVATNINSSGWPVYNEGNSEVWIGRRAWCGGTNELTGKIASFLFYKGKELTSQEIQQNFNATRGRFGL